MQLLNRELEDTNRGVVALYAELDARADFLRKASEVKSRFLSNMTHEFRTPLNSILALANMLASRVDGELTVEQERQVGFIQRSSEALSSLVNDLLDIAKVDAGKVAVKAQEFEVAGLFGALKGMLKPLLAKGSSVTLSFIEPSTPLRLHTDEGKVSQVLRNFISNALKFTERGTVTVSATLDEEGTNVTFAVADTGIGIAPERVARLFDDYGQISDSRTRGPGWGLGLGICRRVIDLLGGTIAAESLPGQGSTFTVRLPATCVVARYDPLPLARSRAAPPN
jgi:signal transduction histidine kinase